LNQVSKSWHVCCRYARNETTSLSETMIGNKAVWLASRYVFVLIVLQHL
jgi:hypothetical protein